MHDVSWVETWLGVDVTSAPRLLLHEMGTRTESHDEVCFLYLVAGECTRAKHRNTPKR